MWGTGTGLSAVSGDSLSLPGGGWSCPPEILTSKDGEAERGNTEGYGDAVQPSSGQAHGLWNPTNWIAVTVQFLASYANSEK